MARWQPPQSADDPLWPEDGPSEVSNAPRTRQEGSWAISAQDMAWAAQQAAAGLLGHHTRPGKAQRIRERGRWGRAIEIWTEAGCPVPPEKP
jgi:hypothetical protein